MKQLKKTFIILIISLICIGSISIYAVSADHNIDTAGQDTTTNLTNPSNPVKTIKLSQSVLNITNGKKSSLTSKIEYEKNDSTPKETVVWSSKNPEIATVSKNGIIKAVNCGKTYIICSSQSGLVKARCKIIVREPYNPVKKISFDKKEMRLGKKDQRVLTLFVQYGNKTDYSVTIYQVTS